MRDDIPLVEPFDFERVTAFLIVLDAMVGGIEHEDGTITAGRDQQFGDSKELAEMSRFLDDEKDPLWPRTLPVVG